MFYKTRKKSRELLILHRLEKRMNLSRDNKQYYFNLQKGYEGETLFDSMTENLQSDCYILNDLLLKIGNTIFQIDSLIIASEKIYFYEIKNYEGDYYYQSEKLFKKPNSEINNPLNQLERSHSLLRQLLQKHGFHLPIEAFVLFINPAFTLYQAPLDKSIILPTQISQHLHKLNAISSPLNLNHKRLADKLISLHINESPFMQLPNYTYDQLRKGITCGKCHSFAVFVQGRKCICSECGYQEKVATAIMRGVQEFKLLFPEKKITTSYISEWCQVIESLKIYARY
ncbi:nuclease-related domain-containing protein [Oceanobacillus salinisoli]|uniref:nuclease-related domain-containing protein n=1 Tax=Oceanobacillus salinisoli TaxID=2678611 RepID=UPI002F360C4E